MFCDQSMSDDYDGIQNEHLRVLLECFLLEVPADN